MVEQVRRVVSLADSVVSYTADGTGRGLVLLHGTSLDAATNFGHLVERLTDRWRVIRPDYAGTGGSTVPAGELRLDTLVAQVAAVIRDAGPEPVDLLGDSLGSVVAAALAARHPELVHRLVLVATWADSADPRHQLVFGTWARLQSDAPELGAAFGLTLAVSPPFLTGMGSAALDAVLVQPAPPYTLDRIRLGQRIDLRAALPRITAPTLIVAGRLDYVVPGYQTAVVRDLIPDAALVELDCGHGVLLERPDELIGLVRDFCPAESSRAG